METTIVIIVSIKKIQSVEKMQKIDPKKIIIDKFTELINAQGIKGVTIDMLAKACGMSKKTVYKYFASKDEIIYSHAEDLMNSWRDEYQKIEDSSLDPINKIDLFFDIPFNLFRDISTVVLKDIRRYYPEIENKIVAMRLEFKDLFIKNMKRGVIEGIFIDLDPIFVSDFFNAAGDRILTPQYIIENNYTVNEVCEKYKQLLLHGLLKKK